jgi:low affinity Fe/Cu permease
MLMDIFFTLSISVINTLGTVFWNYYYMENFFKLPCRVEERIKTKWKNDKCISIYMKRAQTVEKVLCYIIHSAQFVKLWHGLEIQLYCVQQIGHTVECYTKLHM